MKLERKKIVFLGDSITEGTGTSAKEYIYWNVIGQRTGAQVYGYGIGGTRIAPQRFPSVACPWEDLYFASRVDDMEKDADIVVIFGGTNDFGHGDAAMGCIHDRTNESFYGAYHLRIQKVIQRYPSALIVVMTPLHRIDEDEALYNERGIRRPGPLSVYVQAIREVAEFYGIAVADLYANCPIQPRVELQKQMYMPDGLHPNDAGAALVANCLLSVLKSL